VKNKKQFLPCPVCHRPNYRGFWHPVNDEPKARWCDGMRSQPVITFDELIRLRPELANRYTLSFWRRLYFWFTRFFWKGRY
jgi:hypothetical protein